MDRQATIGFVLIFLVLVVWMWLNAPAPKPVVPEKATPTSIKAAPIAKDTLRIKQAETRSTNDSLGKFFGGRNTGQERIIVVETDHYRAELSTRGGALKKWELKDYKTWDGYPVQMVDYEKRGDYNLLFTTTDGRVINTRDLFFDAPGAPEKIRLDKNNFEFEITLTLPSSNGGVLLKRYLFRNDTNGFKSTITMRGMAAVIANFGYQLVWENGLRYAEHDSRSESDFAAAYVYAGKELTEINAAKIGERAEKEFSGAVDWIGTRNKYFAVALIPAHAPTEGAFISGDHRPLPESGEIETYTIALKMPFKGGVEEASNIDVYLGPLDHTQLKSYGVGLEQMMSLGAAWVIRPIAEYVMLPLFGAIHYVVPNWGIVIIVFSIVIKIVLHPLTKSSMRSMKRVQALQPMMEEIKEKYKDDPEKMNRAVMGLYKEYGVNPAGGCLPLLLQLPILYALFSVFRSSIELRQASFVAWIRDLSVPDVIYSLPFQLPLLGIKDISGLALIMGVTMFFQSKMTTTDPRQKAMVWMMPIMMTLLFNSFPSGLNLYYTVFNVLSIGQQMIINKQHGDEPLRKVEPKKKSKGGLFGKLGNIPRLKK
ncbi:MAG: membrane protein insertase YidC [Ignavibacteriales bacterium]|nr:membrane protein insertase YidC [Ignavibacteriales bacterium]